METAFHSGLAWNDFAFTKYINTRVSSLCCASLTMKPFRNFLQQWQVNLSGCKQKNADQKIYSNISISSFKMSVNMIISAYSNLSWFERAIFLEASNRYYENLPQEFCFEQKDEATEKEVLRQQRIITRRHKVNILFSLRIIFLHSESHVSSFSTNPEF